MAEQLVDRWLIRETLERYLTALDDKDWEGIASCFTDDAISRYNDEPGELIGGKGVADWLHRMVAYSVTDHALSNVQITVDGDRGHAHSRVIATLLSGDEHTGRIQVRAIDYRDDLTRIEGRWIITERTHRATMQYDAVAQPRVLYNGVPPDGGALD